MPLICDICGRHLSPAEVNTIHATSVVNAASKGYVPSNLPPTFKSRHDLFGFTVAYYWANIIVKTNSSSDWGLCQDCLDELDRFNSK